MNYPVRTNASPIPVSWTGRLPCHGRGDGGFRRCEHRAEGLEKLTVVADARYVEGKGEV